LALDAHAESSAHPAIESAILTGMGKSSVGWTIGWNSRKKYAETFDWRARRVPY
jgi:hypothetical protein